MRRYFGNGSLPPTARSTPFLCSCAKKRGGAPKKRAYGCRHGSCSVPPASPTDSKPQHPSRLRQADFARPIYPPGISQLDAPIRPVGAYAQMGEAGGPIKVTWRLQSAFLWRLDTVSLGKHQRNGVEWQNKPTTTSQRIGAHAEGKDKAALSFALHVCAVLLGRSPSPLLPVPPHFFALAQRNGVEPQRNARLGAATGAVRSHPPLPRTRSPNVTADCVKLT